MRQFINILIFLAFSLFCSSQELDYDTLKISYDQYRSKKLNDSALIVARKMNHIALKKESDTSLRYAISLGYIGELYLNKKRPDSALPIFKQCLQILESQNRTLHEEYIRTLFYTGLSNVRLEDYKSAESFFKTYLVTSKIFYGEKNIKYIEALENIALLYKIMGQNKLALKNNTEALELIKIVVGEKSKNYIDILDEIGVIYNSMNDYILLEENYIKSIELKQKVLGDRDEDYLEAIFRLANLYFDLEKFNVAEKLYKDLLTKRKEISGENHAEYARILNNLGLLYLNSGDYQSAILYLTQTINIYKDKFGENSDEYSFPLTNLGILYFEIGDYKSAEESLRKVVTITRTILGQNSLKYANALNNFGIYFREMGDYLSAENLFKEGLRIHMEKNDTSSIEYAQLLHNYGNLYKEIGDYNSSISYLKNSIEIIQNYSREKNSELASTLEDYGAALMLNRNHDSAELVLLSAKEIMKNSLGENNYEYALILNKIGELYSLKKQYELAELNFNKSLSILRNIFGESHPAVITVHENIAHLLLKTSRIQDAFEVVQNNFRLKSKKITDNFEWLSDSQKEVYWKKEMSFYEKLAWVTDQSYQNVSEVIGLNYNAALLTKSKLLETKISRESYFREIEDLREDLTKRRRLLAKFESEGDTDLVRFKKLNIEADSLDRLLTLSWPEYAKQKKNLSITWEQVQQNLDSNEAAIEFVRFKSEYDSFYYYNALVLKKGDKNPALIKLCKENDLLSINPERGYSAYYPLVWGPMETTLRDIKTIYYAPTGVLYNIPFHVIYAPKKGGDEIVESKTDIYGIEIVPEHVSTEKDAEYLMDRYILHQLTSTRYLALGLKQKAKDPISKTIAMFGGINYDYIPGYTQPIINSTKQIKDNRSSKAESSRLDYLEGTKEEVQIINQLVSGANWQTTIFENNDATEENIIKLEGKDAKGVLHLATHGFAFPENRFKDTSMKQISLRYSYRYSSNPMVRSGLILSGGNWAWTGSDTLTKIGAEQNGILTSLEVSQLNLKKTKLVVLSACETGLGKIEGSEGTFGLKRGFKLAGVEEIIVSLWPIPDKETMELMTLFYNDLSKSLNPVSSFQKAQSEMRKRYPSIPLFWACFVLVR